MDDTARAEPPIEAASPEPSTGTASAEPQAQTATARAAAPDLRLRAPTPRVAFVIIAGVALVALLYAGRDILAPFVLGLFLVFLLDPPVEWLARRRIGRGWAVLLVYLTVTAIVVALIAITAGPLISQVHKLIDELPTLVGTLRDQLIGLLRGVGLPPDVLARIEDTLAHLDQILAGIDPAVLLPFVRSLFSLLGGLVGFLIVPVWVFYVVKDRPTITDGLGGSLPPLWRTDVLAVAGIVQAVLGKWVRGQLILGSVVGLATLVGLLLLGVFVDPVFARFAVILAVIAGVLELLPIIGPIISAIPAIILAATVSPVAVIAAFVLYLAIQQVENTFLVPKIQGDAVELHPAAVLFVLVLGGAVYGLLGAILAVPIAAAARDVYRYFFRRLSDHESDLAMALAAPHPGPQGTSTDP
jgi:predicted PurR-regulated permease PerM